MTCLTQVKTTYAHGDLAGDQRFLFSRQAVTAQPHSRQSNEQISAGTGGSGEAREQTVRDCDSRAEQQHVDVESHIGRQRILHTERKPTPTHSVQRQLENRRDCTHVEGATAGRFNRDVGAVPLEHVNELVACKSGAVRGGSELDGRQTNGSCLFTVAGDLGRSSVLAGSRRGVVQRDGDLHSRATRQGTA